MAPDTKASPAMPLQAPADAALAWLLGAMLVFAPLLRSGQPALAVLVLELSAVLLLVLVLWQPRGKVFRRTELVALALLFAVPALYLIPIAPIPVLAGLLEWLPGREPYLAAQDLMAQGAAPGTSSALAGVSLYPFESESAWLFVLVPIGVFAATRVLTAAWTTRLMLLLLALTTLQALLGLLQYGASEGSPQFLGMQMPDLPSAKGTYTNRNHLAGLLEMMLPVAIALMVFAVGARGRRGRWSERLVFLGSARGHVAVLYGALALLLLVGLVFTRSRTGILLGMLAVLLSTLAFARRIGGTNVYGPVGTLVAFALGIAVAIGLLPVLDRFAVAEAVADARWSIFAATFVGIGAFAPVGSGPGTYPQVFPAFQPPELGRWFINHAHNDYLEWLFEGGLAAAALIALLLVLYGRQWARVWTGRAWSQARFVQVGAGIGLLLLLLHSLVDFNLHIPANVTFFAFLAGVFFAAPAASDDTGPRRRRAPKVGEDPAPEAPAEPSPVPEQIRNPFLD